MAFLILLLIFLSWRAFDNWVLFISSKLLSYAGLFPYGRYIYNFGLDQVTSALANFDGIHYLYIAHRGNYMSWEQAYFPFYPLLIRFVNLIFRNELITGILISNVSFLVGLIFLFKLFKFKIPNTKYWMFVFLLMFPTSFFFGTAYTEGLFFFLLISTLYFLKKEKYLLVGVMSVLASMTRLIGVFLVIPIIFHLIQKLKVKSQNLNSKVKSFLYLIFNTKYFMLVFSPFIGLMIYCFYLWKTTGDPFMFLTSQPVFGANRSTNIILLPQVVWRYIKIFFTASHNYQYYVSIFEFIMFFLVFTVLIFDLFKHLKINNWKLIRNLKLEIRNYDRLALNLFSFANLILPTLTGTFSSVPRYALFSISIFLFLTEIKSRILKIIIAIVFIVFHVIILSLFGQGYFIG